MLHQVVFVREPIPIGGTCDCVWPGTRVTIEEVHGNRLLVKTDAGVFAWCDKSAVID